MNDGELRFGICADVHKDIMHDADERLGVFIDRMNRERPDFIIQLGDFCRPYDYNRSFMDTWESFEGPRYHVLGNHDNDGGFSREDVLAYWSMPARFYSFDAGGRHFVVLDGNDVREGRPPGYPRFMAADQLEWLRRDLKETGRPTILFSHQNLLGTDSPEEGIENGAEVRSLLEEENRRSGRRKVIACFSGHNHMDAHDIIGGIHYVQINSMSNYWMGGDYLRIRYGEEIDRDYPYIKYTAPYREPLFGHVTLDADSGIRIRGVTSSFVGPSPWEVGYPHRHIADRIVPAIRDRAIEIEPDPD